MEESLDGQSWSLINDHVAATSLAFVRGANQLYRYRANACNQAGCGGYSAPVSTQVVIRPAVAPVISLPGSSNNGAYTVSWSGVAYAVSYQVQERVNGGGWTGVSTTAGLSLAMSGRGDGTYGYRVQACNLDGCGPFSAEPSVSVLYPVSGTPSISAPASVNGLSYTVSWSAVDRATRYNLKAVVPGGGTVTNVIYALSQSYAQTQPGTWSYQVQACNDAGCGPWSAQISVTLIVNPPPAVPTGLTVTQRTAMDCRVSWMPVVGASYYQLSEAGWVFSWPASFYTFDGICPRPYKIRACNAQGACSAWSSPK